MPCWGMVAMLVCLVITLHLLLFPLVEALHITPLSPRRGVGGEAFLALLQPYILLPSPLGEGLGVRPVGAGAGQ